ncbi:NAD-dependent protein deacylase [Staphylococcus sp. SQ8-PEA]|uniref:protein acetyllysine N-acetyltransferase n=1 Tax=Staphylococcus marylandisciuri TaxID=2981529 RepID=A0ABT2QMB2_9STAP|nr:NAD-dependent protein deacylase [Staphylococcus marylandisciuri]MCU5745126.1 NAD-dependent protein deacylase [Staphylococcus marylandisciuri]
MTHHIDKMKEIINNSKNILFFTGAGISVASGIPDFRSKGGLNDLIAREGYSPEYLLSTEYFRDDPQGFMKFVHRRLIMSDKAPNLVHEWISKLESEGRSLGVITQNIDGLHTDAGSIDVDELHGTLNRFYCVDCGAQYSKRYVMEKHLMTCDDCEGRIRPDIVLYGEVLNQDTITRALNKLSRADTLVVLGSSLIVQPAAGLVSHFNGDHFIIVNRDTTAYDQNAEIVLRDDMLKVVSALRNEDENSTSDEAH